MAIKQPTLQLQPAPANPVGRWLSREIILNWEVIAYVVIFLLAVFTRFYALGDRVMSHDESLHTRYSWNLYANGDFHHTPLMHGPLIFHAVAFFYFMFGDNDFTARIYVALLGIALVMSPLFFRRWLGRTGAVLAALLVLISPLMLYYGRYIREDTPSIFFTTVMVYCVMMYLDGPAGQRRKAHWLYIFSAAMIGSLASKESAFIYIAIFGVFLTLYWLVRLYQHIRQSPSRTAYLFLVISILLAAVVALGMYIVLSIVPFDTAREQAQALGGWFTNLESSSFISWTVIVVVAALLTLLGTLYWAFREGYARVRWSDVLIIFAVALVVCLGLIIVEERSHLSGSSETETAAPIVPDQETAVLSTTTVSLPLPILAFWVICAIAVAIALIAWTRGWWGVLRRFPEFDILIIMGTLILPWGTPLFTWLSGYSPVDYSTEGIGRALLTLVPAAIVSFVYGWIWNWKRWLICVIIFHAIFAFFFTTMFTNILGLATGMVGSLGYWLEQQEVRRGSQPQYYYLLLIMPFYEFLPIIGSVLAMFGGLTVFWRYRRARLEAELPQQPQTDELPATLFTEERAEQQTLGEMVEDPELEAPLYLSEKPKRRPIERGEDWLRRFPFLTLVAWWALFNAIAYTLAGEKMPWLGTHITFPMIFLAGWFFGTQFEKVEREKFLRGGWAYLILFPVLFILLFQVLAPFLMGQGPFAGLQQAQQAQGGQWIAVVAASGLVLLIIYQFTDRTGWRHLRHMFVVGVFAFLALLTARSALMASFINYDLATEYLVYAHGAPAVKTVLEEIEELSVLTTDGMDLNFSYDNETSWPYSWYFRDYPNATFFGSSPSRPVIDNSMAVVVGEANRAAVEPLLEDRFYHFEYIRLWWPMQDYFNLNAQRVNNALNFSPENVQAAQLRRGLFDIWWSRDYTRYGEAVGRTFDITQWPVADRMHLYVRKDVASQIWSLGIGDGSVENPLTQQAVNVCNSNWNALPADLVFGASGSNLGELNRPLGMAIGADGNLYVAEEGNNRVQVFNTGGEALRLIAPTESPNVFVRPNGVDVAADGSVVVADTWNFRVQVLSPEGELRNVWGERGEYGPAAVTEPIYGFWGPRAVTVDDEGRIYVADTGNKRVRVYTETGAYVRDIGGAGTSVGQLEEPVGLAIHPDGRLFVADTWNRRISVFSLDGTPLTTFPVRAWYDEQGNRPYLALDVERNRLYVTDPDAGRVLVYDTAGNCLGSFGQASREAPGANQFSTVGGIAVDPRDGSVYVADAGSGRILKFPVIEFAPAPPAEATPEVGAQG